MLHALSAFRPARRLSAAVAALLCAALLAGPVTPAFSQSLVAPAQTKEEAEKAREEAADAANEGGGGISTEVWLAITAVVLLAGATIYMVRDSRAATGAGDPRRPVARPAANPRETRGAPKNMFEGEAKPGGQVGKQAKRTKSKRQKQARKANRPR